MAVLINLAQVMEHTDEVRGSRVFPLQAQIFGKVYQNLGHMDRVIE